MKLANLIPEQLEKIKKSRQILWALYIAKAGIMAGFRVFHLPPYAQIERPDSLTVCQIM